MRNQCTDPRRRRCLCRILLLAFLGASAAVHGSPAEGESWETWGPSRLKAPEAVALARNPFRLPAGAVQGTSPSPGTGRSPGADGWVGRVLREGIRGLARTGDESRLLFGSRILAVGQELVLSEPRAGAGGCAAVRLRLKAIEGMRIRFAVLEAPDMVSDEVVVGLEGLLRAP